MEEIKSFFASRGLGTSELAKGLVIHEVLGVAILFSAWGGCYFLRPSARFMAVLKNKNHKQWKQAQARISVSPLASRISGLVPQGKAAAVGLAFGESVFLRKLFMPILVPLKLWIALQLVLMLNPVKDAGEEESKLK